MNVTDKIKVDFLNGFNNYQINDFDKIIAKLINELSAKYDDEDFVLDVLQSLDTQHDNFIHIQVGLDAQHNVNFAIQGSKNILTPLGKEFLENNA